MTNSTQAPQTDILLSTDFAAVTSLRRQHGLFTMREGQKIEISNEFVAATLQSSGNVKFAMDGQNPSDLKIEKGYTAQIFGVDGNTVMAIEQVVINGSDRTHYAIWSSQPVKCDLN